MSNDVNEPLILAIETATRTGGVAVTRGAHVLSAVAGDSSVSHSANLLEMIEQALSETKVSLSDIELYAVAEGPGSFTGLRIGLATAKAFAVHLRRRVVGVSTLAAVAHASDVRGDVVSLLTAGRGEVFAQRFSVNDDLVSAVDEAQHLTPRAVCEKYARIESLAFAGEGMRMIEELRVPPLDGIVEDENVLPKVGTPNTTLAPSIALLAFRAFEEGKSVVAEELRAVYVRASDAEINERWQQQKLQQQPGS
ncbi:MAG TPA: tRNA (adenosine(37)-N6)-threonylcarbamoyltransferase complex dimerization subunit type 1 TsaB [Pyrinomonadaceae bacterium]|nr:tRNA (adenosine(37)-N6)-threonylcarbamoyltransferase complex dimerization subunit type 1 TsaB [Pyrinomonadaceae bacterium]